jgi:hypothetical protein
MKLKIVGLFILLFSISSILHAQKAKKKEYIFKDHLWYGINVGGIGIGGNVFSIGLAPMGGYKVNDDLALGLITKLDYQYQWQQYGDNYHFFNYGGGVLAKYLLFNSKYFAQIEYDLMSYSVWDFQQQAQVRRLLPFYYIGGGVSYPGNNNWSSEIVILFNLNQESSQIIFPLNISYAFLYNF